MKNRHSEKVRPLGRKRSRSARLDNESMRAGAGDSHGAGGTTQPPGPTPPRLIGIDQPFDYAEVVKVTGAAYVQNLLHDGIVSLSYGLLKTTASQAPVSRQECIWMKAGIVNFKMCDNKGDCDHCEFDLHMRRAMSERAPMRQKPTAPDWCRRVDAVFEPAGNPCIHALSGQAGAPEECREHYECFQCPVHERLSGDSAHEPWFQPHYSTAAGYRVADDYYYHFGHSWARMEEEGTARIGIDDFAGRIIGPALEMRLPEVGDTLRQGEIGAVLVRNGHQAPVQSPLSGKVLSVNPNLRRNPALSHADAYYKGWLLMVEPFYPRNELKALYFGPETLRWIEMENRLLLDSLGPEYARLAATGGEPTRDLFGAYPQIGWDKLVGTFLRTRARPGAGIR